MRKKITPSPYCNLSHEIEFSPEGIAPRGYFEASDFYPSQRIGVSSLEIGMTFYDLGSSCPKCARYGHCLKHPGGHDAF